MSESERERERECVCVYEHACIELFPMQWKIKIIMKIDIWEIAVMRIKWLLTKATSYEIYKSTAI